MQTEGDGSPGSGDGGAQQSMDASGGGMGTDATSDGGSPSADGGGDGGGLPTATASANDWAQWPMPNSAVDVEAGAPHPEAYVDHGDGTVTDSVTGLLWQRDVTASTYPWSGAQAYCKGLSLAGHSDWRLPTYIELVSLVDYSHINPALSPAFPSAPALPFWSSTPWTLGAEPWIVSFHDGATQTDNALNSNSVRCVR